MDKLSIIMPVYNEEKTIELAINRVLKVKFPIKFELIIVNDGSSDNSLSLIKVFESNKSVKVISYPRNKGKGFAVKTGFKHSSGSILAVQDADLEYHPKELLKLLKRILNNRSKVVYGSRFLNKKFKLFGKNKVIIVSHLFGNKLLSLFTNILFGSRLTDMETCYKMFKKECLKGIVIESNGFDFEPEITSKFLKKGYKIEEVEIEHKSRNFDEGKKITKFDGIKAFYKLIKFRFFD